MSREEMWHPHFPSTVSTPLLQPPGRRATTIIIIGTWVPSAASADRVVGEPATRSALGRRATKYSGTSVMRLDSWNADEDYRRFGIVFFAQYFDWPVAITVFRSKKYILSARWIDTLVRFGRVLSEPVCNKNRNVMSLPRNKNNHLLFITAFVVGILFGEFCFTFIFFPRSLSMISVFITGLAKYLYQKNSFPEHLVDCNLFKKQRKILICAYLRPCLYLYYYV